MSVDIDHLQRIRLALEVGVIADNQRVVANQLDEVIAKLPTSEDALVIDLNIAASLARDLFHALDAKAEAIDPPYLLPDEPPSDPPGAFGEPMQGDGRAD